MNKAEILQLGERLVVVEGGSGAGKTTAIDGLRKYLNEDWKLWREPGGTVFGELMRDAVQGGNDRYPVDPVAAMLAYNGARANLIGLEVIPWLERGGFGLLDRYWYSTYAYQGGGEGIDKGFITAIAAQVTRGLEPGLVIYYDLAPELAEERKKGKTDLDRYDLMKLDFQQRVRDAYLELAQQRVDNWRIIDAAQAPERVLEETVQALVDQGYLLPSWE